MRKTLPIGKQDFKDIREKGNLYVDKTEALYRLITEGEYYFLSRPRRFGKSLTLSTLAHLFRGEESLFEGLWIKDHWDWRVSAPVLHLAFNTINYRGQSLEEGLIKALADQASRYKCEVRGDLASEQLVNLIIDLYQRHGQVVILIDEYDKPIIDFLGKDELPQAIFHQKELKSFYSSIKSCDAYIRFLLITGVSKFSKVGVFSDLNNLRDISLSPPFAALTGITQEELLHYFSQEISTIGVEMGRSTERVIDEIKEWYNGYSFDGKTFLYNPFSLLNFFADRAFSNYWFASGTPTFLIDLMRERNFYAFEQQQIGRSGFEAYDLEHLEMVPLLFQTGYLTIKEYDRELLLFTLDYPNREVKDSMLQYLLGAYTYEPVSASTATVTRLSRAFRENDVKSVREIISDAFQSIPYQIFVGAKENLYHAVVHVLFTYLGQYVRSEVSSLRGRLDSLVETETHVYIMEFKLNGSATGAVEQIFERDYAASLRNERKKMVGIEVNFSGEEKRIVGWEVRSL